MRFPRQEYGSGLLFPSPGDLPHSGIEPMFPALQWIHSYLWLKFKGRLKSEEWLASLLNNIVFNINIYRLNLYYQLEL